MNRSAINDDTHEKAGATGPDSSPEAVLVELYELLETYGPHWYTEELHDRVFAARQSLVENLRDARITPMIDQ